MGTELFMLPFTAAERELLLPRLWTLLTRQAGRYMGCGNSSVAVERAQDLLEGLLFTLEAAMEGGVPKEQLLRGDMDAALRRGQELLRQKKTAALQAWMEVSRTMPAVQNVYYNRTMGNLGQFFRRYELLYEPHHVPCDIDYWPLCPMSEQRRGVCYVEEYLHRLRLENEFLSAFSPELLQRLYQAYLTDYEESLFNLCEPVLANAVALALLGESVLGLSVSPEQRERLAAQPRMETLVHRGVGTVCRQLLVQNEAYFQKAAESLTARLAAALPTGDLSGIFLSL